MRQHRVTSQNFVLPGETGEADAVMDAQDLYQIKKLAGLVTEGEAGALAGIPATPHADENGISSPLGSNISVTGNERRALEAEYNAKPGTDLWFIINFTKPYLNGSLQAHVEDYLKKHPQHRPRPNPGD